MQFERLEDGRVACPFDHHTPEFGQHYFELLDELRAESPLVWSENYGGFWVATTHHLVRQLAMDSASVSVDPGPERTGGIRIPPTPGSRLRPRFVPGEAEGREHDDFRLALNPHFSKQRVLELQPRIAWHVDQATDRVLALGDFDMVGDFVGPLLAGIACEHLGLEVDHPRDFFRSLFRMVTYSGTSAVEFGKVTGEFADAWSNVVNTVAARRVEPRDDVISHLTRWPDPKFTDEQIQMMTLNVILGSADTTSSLLSQAIIYLDRDRALRARLAADHELIRPAVEEFLRLFAVAMGPARTVTRDVDVDGVTMKAGDRLLLSYAAANHDPSRYEHPYEFDLDRGAALHVAMGVGTHFCLGAWMAKAIAATALAALLDRAPDFRVHTDEIVTVDDKGSLNHYESVPASVR
jgi:cytochrome P450